MRCFSLGLLLTLLGTSTVQAQQPAAPRPADPKATGKTVRLYRNMLRLADTNLMFGHQDDLAYGLDENGKRWKGDPDRSDVKSVTGAYPAVYGWDLGHLELDSARNLDNIPFKQIRGYMKQAYKRGGINTVSWHLNNPVNGKSSWDTTRTVAQLLPGGAYHAKYVAYLDRVADYVGNLRQGFSRVPVVFRPFHEHTGHWFWWCENVTSADDYKALWRFTVDYLRNTKKVHNLLIGYSSSSFRDKEHYLKFYPGDDYVDLMGFDTYYMGDGSAYQREMARQLPLLTEIAREHGKIAALTETGFERIPQPEWWTKTLLPLLEPYPLSYVLVWRNGRPDHYYAPYPGQTSADDFRRFYANPRLLFQDKLTPLNIYRRR